MAKAGQFMCTGVVAMDGCGAELTMVELRRFDGRCEHCALDWDERVRAWRFGKSDPDLDEHFAEAPRRRSAPVQARRAKAA
ncbi:hypothetical protein [Pseudorhodoplanes sp.]|uniref:hypothetical protein n=1 Tax=Pseudorhodoplanes sp. TaxID=1934341 RepID=UPI002BD506F2|nr:hypothetical protein [Pseudorhodoplanes sp.]HWV42568.1 hypothetical protein [Pseudorhodoplanes sp.]